jgi:hypothetical protein
MSKKQVLAKVSRIARVKGFRVTPQQQVALAEFCERPDGERVIVGVANMLRRRKQPFDGFDVLVMANYLA